MGIMGRMAVAKVLYGKRDVEGALNYLAQAGSKQVSRAVVTGAAAPVRKAIRSQVNGSSSSTAVKREARKTIGSSIKKQPDGSYGMKAGFGVGKPSKTKREQAKARAAASKPGVGLSSRDIHWFVLGAGLKTGGRIQKSTGRNVGVIQAELAGLIPVAVNAARGQMISEGARRAAVAMKREAMKAKARKRR